LGYQLSRWPAPNDLPEASLSREAIANH
jgi:hypothetical protein